MNLIRTHIVFRLLSIVLIASLFAPSAVKFAHIFEHHDHVVCKGEDSTHIHQIDLDCEFHDFHLNNTFLYTQNQIDFFVEQDNHPLIKSQYLFISDYQRLHFSLRGPPQINL